VIVPFLVAGALLATVTGERPQGLSSLAPAALLAFPLLLIPLTAGTQVRTFVMALAVLLVLAWLVSRTASEPGGMVAVLAAVAVSATVQSLIALWEARTGHTLNLYSSAGTQQFAPNYLFTYGTTRRPTGSLTDPISLGNVLAIALPLIVVLAIEVRGRIQRAGAIAAAMLTGTALALSLSRMSWVGAVVGTLVAIALLPRRERRATAPALAAGVALIIAVTLIAAGPAFLGRLSSIGNPTATQGQSIAQQGVAEGDRRRLEYWNVALTDGFLGHPVAGIGIGNIGPFLLDRVVHAGLGLRGGTAIFIHAHSTYFQLLAEGGLLALVLFVVFLRGLWRDARAGPRALPVLGPGLAGAAVALLICWSTDWVIHYPSVAAPVGVVLGAIAAGGRLGRLSPRPAPSAEPTASR
jgi:O-antigen ligase